MNVEDYNRLPDGLTPKEVRAYLTTLLKESEAENPDVTVEKLILLGERQWHTYELLPRGMRSQLQEWIIKNWTDGSEKCLESFLIIACDYALDKEIFAQALKRYHGKSAGEFERDLANSREDYVDPWWSMKPCQ
ncbi:MAG: hypothetical protein A4E71_00515 [Smithella sp. PtaU1.Bin162]|nr:MAG: hypothetical protein A4E71_00515 [Smithella sp. PtaU1.Bin162]